MARRSNEHEREDTFPEHRLRKRNTYETLKLKESRNEEQKSSGPEKWECQAL